MGYTKRLVLEAIAVGAMAGLVCPIGLYAIARESPDSWPRVVFACAVSGIAIHLLCEATGLNRWYLRNSAASIASS